MALSSMTGFARSHGVCGSYAWAWELKSVNAKGLDVRLRLPPGWDAVETPARARAAEVTGVDPAAWPAEDGSVKVSAAWLIERAGFGKGYTGGHRGVAVSGKHTLALTNRGTGTTVALLALAREIRDGVRKVFDVDLHPEPVFVGCAL